MARKMWLAVWVLALSSVAALAADFTGKWTASFDTQIGKQVYTYDLHADGAKLTGKAINQQGSVDIQEGKIDGDNISFVELLNFNGNSIRIVYTGKIEGDTIKFSRQVGEFATETFVATRTK